MYTNLCGPKPIALFSWSWYFTLFTNYYKGKTWEFVQIQNIQGNDLKNKFGKGIIFFEMTMVENVCLKFSLTIAKNKEYNNIWLKCTFFNKTKILKGKFESSSTRLEVSFSKLKYLEFVDWTIGIYFMNYSPTIANKGVTPYQ